MAKDLDAGKQARTLRLLSNCYIQINDLDKAEHLAKMANEVQKLPTRMPGMLRANKGEIEI